MNELEATRTGYAEVNDARLYYEDRGDGDLLLLIHAGVTDNRMWNDQFDVFARDYRVIRYDMRGFGKSMVPPLPFSSYEDVSGLLSFIGVERAYVIGQSFGGYVAIDFALAHPEMVEALILGSPNVSGYEPGEELRRFGAEEEEALEKGNLEAATETNLRMWVDGPHRSPDQVDAAVRERVREMQMQIFDMSWPEGVEEIDLSPPAITRLDEIRVPTLVIVGDQDVSEFLELADTVAEKIESAHKVIIPGAAHLPNMEQPGKYNETVLEFLEEVG